MPLINTKFLLSAPSKEFWPTSNLDEIVLLGRSNVGKSSFINLICNDSTIAKVSSQPGHTKYLNFFNVNNMFTLVDAPGYGYSKASKGHDEQFRIMMEEYLFDRKNLKAAVLLLNSNLPMTNDDLMIYDLLLKRKLKIFIVATKSDKLNQSGRYKLMQEFQNKLKLRPNTKIYLTSTLIKSTAEEITNDILSFFMPPI
jgi:GTP-binding protein